MSPLLVGKIAKHTNLDSMTKENFLHLERVWTWECKSSVSGDMKKASASRELPPISAQEDFREKQLIKKKASWEAQRCQDEGQPM